MNTTLIKIGAVLALLLGFALWAQDWHDDAYQLGRADAVAERKKADDEKMAKDAASALAKERALRNTFDTATTTRLEDEKPHEKAISDTRAAVRSGAVRLRAPVAVVHPDPAPADTTAAGRPGAEEVADLVPAAADNVLVVAAGSAKDVRDYNAIVDLYNLARATCNAP